MARRPRPHARDSMTHAQRKKTADERFDEKVSISANGCHLWTSAVGSRGYGIFWLGFGGVRSVFAHRYSYARAKGPIPDGLLLMHSCDTPLCVNPAHLSPGTTKANADDASAKGRLATGERNKGGGKLTTVEALAIRTSPLGCQKLSRLYGVSASTVKLIRSGKLWRCAGGF